MQSQNNLSVFLNASVVLSLAGWYNINYYFKGTIHYRAITFQWGCICSLHLMSASKSFIIFFSHPTHCLKVNCKSNHLAIIANTIYQSICMYILVHTKYLWYIIAIDFHAIKNITTGSVKQKKTKGISDNGCLCPLNILCWKIGLYHSVTE